MMISIITGDIINSRDGEMGSWIHPLKQVLNQYGAEPHNWQVFRGDSFQLSINPQKALLAALHIKSTIKQIKPYDVRMAIGIGKEEYNASKITEANGSAYVRSGECFDELKKYDLAIKSGNTEFDSTINIMLRLSTHITKHWSSVVSEVIQSVIENPKMNQNEIANLLDKSQGNISDALKRGGFDEMMSMNKFYTNYTAKL
jgi:predicted XRE-type DNA-binding protein